MTATNSGTGISSSQWFWRTWDQNTAQMHSRRNLAHPGCHLEFLATADLIAINFRSSVSWSLLLPGSLARALVRRDSWLFMPLPHSYYSYAWLACWSSGKDTRDSLSCFINSQDYWPSPCLHPWSVSCAFKKSLRAWIYPRVSRRRARIRRMDRLLSSCPHRLCSLQASTSLYSAQWRCHPHRVCRYHRFGSMDLY